MKWTGAQWGCYNAIRSGLLCHKGKLRFLTLTSAVDMKRSISDCFKVLVNRIERMTPSRFVKLGFIPVGKVLYYFPDLGLNDPLKLDYLYVLTSEGANGVLHVLYFGSYLNEKWLKDSWEEITGCARQLFIENVKDCESDAKDVARYIVNQSKIFGYVAGQSKYVRHSYSKDWIYRGWRSDFIKLKFVCCHNDRFVYSVLSDDYWKHWDKWLSSRSVYNSDINAWLVYNL
jgi:hypothetical protein